jgi:2-polyprenyl-6-methoxyphenol hydroxylase-like FAD-dependent oxidoreductase
MRALDSLGVGDAIRDAGRPQEGGAIYTGRGTVLSSLDGAELAARYGCEMVMIQRAALLQLLREALGATPIHLGETVVRVSLDGQTIVELGDGRKRSADLIVGADGIGSAVRSSLFGGEPPRQGRLTAWRALAAISEEIRPRLRWGECWHEGALFGVTPVNEGRVYWWAAERGQVDAKANSTERREGLLERFGDWPDPIGDLIASTPAKEIIRTPLLERRPLRRLAKGNVVLLGDAAHAMLPHLGQGACQAVEDAAVLGAAVSATDDLEQALRRYDKQRSRRTRSVVRQSAQMARMAHMRGPLASARNVALRAMPAAVSLRQIDRIVDWDPSG